MRIYLAGKMTGLPDNGYPLFNEAAASLRAIGFHVENPAENDPPECGTWMGWMRKAVAQLMSCDAVVVLPNWMDSRGARTEKQLAENLGLPVYSLAFMLAEGVN